MRITHLGHACVLLEMADTRLLIDPGTFAEGFSEVRDLDAVLVTHQHPDHLDPERVPGLLAANPGARVLTDAGSLETLAGLGIDAQAHDGPTVVGSVTVTPVGELHALIHDDIPRIPNVGVRLDADGEPSFFHPGDALDAEPGEVDVLAFPLQAPWQRSREMTAFLRRWAPRHAMPVHDGLLQPRGRELYLGQARGLGSPDTEIHDLAGRGAVEFGLGE
ncbi:MBL fold metallo-hydrolase [Phycicoccus sp. HDW14]|uniref:MBL fold metallo-hydrolase n=1 Tax=Phycicoccus sp. HDW14 TaxID=2714941 RepID=UPI00140739F7|nr:MBL fold metallo-hydrolase [Phycicoccus sp. HDW14]QIM21088.1 MBL fold metallo-hydrolase [Phycicoccus sp. HDW14]